MVTIEGTAFPLDILNKNGWGIPSTEADNAISSLKSSVIRICPRDSPHGCDISEDPNAEIGRIVDAWQEGNRVKVRASITDSIASQKLLDGTWGNGWSVYSHVDGQTSEGWATGIKARSLTLVDNPAWGESQFSLAASENEPSALRFFQPFKILVGNTMTDPIPTTGGGGIPAEIQSMIDAQKAQIEELTNVKTGLETEIGTLKTELGELKTVAASKDVELASKITMEEAQALVASAIQADHEAQSKSAAIEKLTAARKDAGLETKAEDYAVLTASRIEELAADFSKTKLSAAQVPQYPAKGGSKSGFTVGRPLKNGEWEV